MIEKLIPVKTYFLSGDGIEIEFSMENPEYKLVYKKGQKEHEFEGQAIYREKTQLGLIISAVLDVAPDLQKILFSVVIPSANRGDDGARSIPVQTFAVQTNSRTSIGGPEIIEGQIQTYETFILKGNAH